jgi:hypothetical protein
MSLAPCDYREFCPYLNQDPCGTLIADLVDQPTTAPTIALDLEDCESLPWTVDGYFQVQGVRVAKESGFDQQKFGRADQGEAAFSLQEGNRRRNWLTPARRRVAGIGGVIPRPEESLPRAPVPAVPLPWAPGRLCPRLNAYVTG